MQLVFKHPQSNRQRRQTMPCDEKTIGEICDWLEIPNDNQATVTIAEIANDNRCNQLLQGTTHNLNELNYLLRVMDSHSNLEKTSFFAAAHAYHVTQTADLINLAFNTHCYGVIHNLENPYKQGLDLYRTEKQMVTLDEMDRLDGEGYLKEILETKNLQLTPYGLVYQNNNTPDLLYQNGHFPCFLDGGVAVLSVQKDESTEYLNLPTERSAMVKALDRLGASDHDECLFGIEYRCLFDRVVELATRHTDFDHLNAIAKELDRMNEKTIDKLETLSTQIDLQTYEELTTLVQCQQEFELYPNVTDANSYGRYLVAQQNRLKMSDELAGYFDFTQYGEDCMTQETGAFVPEGYLVYRGYNQNMTQILAQRLGLQPKQQFAPQELKLYMPLKVTSFQYENDWGDYEDADYCEELYDEEVARFEYEIARKIQAYDSDLPERGLMEYYHKTDTINGKIKRYAMSVENVNGRLMGVATLQLHAPLTPQELETFEEQTLSGQLSDGWGEGFEQQDIKCEGRMVNVGFWDSSDDWRILTADELGLEPPSQQMDMSW